MKRYIIVLLAISTLFTASCRKYVEVEQKGKRTLKYTDDYQYLLNNLSVFEFSYGFPILSSDDIGIENTVYQNTISSQWASTYTWAVTRYGDTDTDLDWERFYKQISVCNEITEGVLSSVNGTDATKNFILAQAKVQRAYAYLQLVNMYAKPYNPATAATDLGVPMLLRPDLFASLKRVSVAEVYVQILKDLNEALVALPNTPSVKSEPSKVAAYAILAETALQMRDFSAAGTYASNALAIQATLLDYNTYLATPSTLPKRMADPEIILSKRIGGSYLPTLSAELLTLLGTRDLRYTLNTGTFSSTATYGRSVYHQFYVGEEINVGPNVPEMMLIKAESEARAGNIGTAVTLLNNLRVKRFKAADYVALTATTPAEALALVIDERRREFFGRGFRWFDQRRLNQDAAFVKTYTRTFKGLVYTLEPNSNKFTYGIGNKYILLNPEIEQNPQ